MDRATLEFLLGEIAAGRVSAAAGMARLGELSPGSASRVGGDGAHDVSLSFATVDVGRKDRTGAAEVVFGEGKSAAQIAEVLTILRARGQLGLATRVGASAAASVLQQVGSDAVYHPDARCIVVGALPEGVGSIAVVSAGTADGPVAAEVVLVAQALGNSVHRVVDVGVAGVHRVLRRLDELRSSNVVVVVAGMDGALPSVVGGLVAVPVIAVPTSVGYGSSFGGVAALLSMLNSCAPGVAVMNIDNGFGAAFAASRVNQAVEAARAGKSARPATAEGR